MSKLTPQMSENASRGDLSKIFLVKLLDLVS
jgi:hypothetical protein